MSSRLRNLLLTVVLLAAAAATWLQRPADDSANAAAGAAGGQQGFYLLDAVFSGLDETGAVIYQLAATRIEGSENPDQLQFHDVEIRYGEDVAMPWQITAESAQRQPDGNTLVLTDVVIESIADGTAQNTRIEAATLELEPKRQLATTTGRVRFTIGDSRIDAVGLTADLRNERISLESDVSGRVTP